MEHVGDWVLHERLGAGGMGTVYRAERGGLFAALKVIHPGLAADESFRQRFRREIAISGLVRAENLVRVVDYDAESDPPWLATELLDGPTLAEALHRDGPLEPDKLRAVAVGVAKGIAALQAAGVVHRDVKPSNIILTETRPVLVDFGVAAAAELTSMTSTGMRLGSAGWMSPEQVEGRGVGPATDVFSWAVSVAYAATGRHPYGTGAPEALMYRIANGEPDLSAVPATWLSLLRRAMDPDPERRPPAADLAAWAVDPASSSSWPTQQSTQPAIASTTAQEASSTRVEVAEALPRRGIRKIVAVATAAAVVAVAAGGLGWWLNRPGEPSPATDATPVRTQRPVTPSPPSERSSKTATASVSPGYRQDPVKEYRGRVSMDEFGELADFASFLAGSIGDEIDFDVVFTAMAGTLETYPDGILVAEILCSPLCSGVQGFQLGIAGTDKTVEVTEDGDLTTARLKGRYVVDEAATETGYTYNIALRVPGTLVGDAGLAGKRNVTDKRVCEEFNDAYLPYPGRPLGPSLAEQFSEHVRLVQDLINFQGTLLTDLPCIAESGYYDDRTEYAVRVYQQTVGLEVDGFVGPVTYGSLLLTFE